MRDTAGEASGKGQADTGPFAGRVRVAQCERANAVRGVFQPVFGVADLSSDILPYSLVPIHVTSRLFDRGMLVL